MYLTIAYSKIRKWNLVLINNDTHQRETVSEWPTRWEKMGNLGSSFPRNIDMWREILEFGGKFCIFVHINTIQIGENWACFPGNKHFFILWWPIRPPLRSYVYQIFTSAIVKNKMLQRTICSWKFICDGLKRIKGGVNPNFFWNISSAVTFKLLL